MDPVQLTAFLEKTQPDIPDLEIGNSSLQSFLTLLQDEITRRGVVDVLRRGVKDGAHHRDLFFGVRTSADPPSPRRFTQNRFSVIPGLRYSEDESRPTVDVCLFVNGLPIATIELSERSVDDAIERYKNIPAAQEPLFQPGRCMAHFAVDEKQVYVCSELRGDDSSFQTFNQGSSEGAGNPPNLFGIATEYLWRDILTRPGVVDMIENYAQMFERADERTGDLRATPIFPRYHQLDVLRQLLADVDNRNVGHRYLLEHSDANGTSHSIAWLAGQLIDAQQDSVRIFDTVFVLTDRPDLVRQVGESVRGFSRISARVKPDSNAPTQLHEAVENGTRIIIANVEQLPGILDEIEAHQRGRRFAFVFDEASSNGTEEQINGALSGRTPLPNTSTFVFAPTANATTLELFGRPFNDRGTTRYSPFHSYAG